MPCKTLFQTKSGDEMRTITSIFLITANCLTSIIVIALAASLFVFPNSEISLELQSYTGIYTFFFLLCVFEPVKWFTYKKTIEFKHQKIILFFITYGILLVTMSIVYQFYYLSLVGLLYITFYFILKRISQNYNIIIEKTVDGQPLKSDSLFHPLPNETNSDSNIEK